MLKDEKSFWKEIKKINNANIPLANCIDGVVGCDNISSQWKTHFSNILNSSHDTSSKNAVMHELSNLKSSYFERFSHNEVQEAVKNIKNGKSAGKDGVYGEHFKYAHESINVLLALVFNCMVIHGFLPDNLMDTLLVPLIKDKKGNVTHSDNYRPQAITCLASKIREFFLESF